MNKERILNTASNPVEPDCDWNSGCEVHSAKGSKVRISPTANKPLGTACLLSDTIVWEKSTPKIWCPAEARVDAMGRPVPQPRSRIRACGGITVMNWRH